MDVSDKSGRDIKVGDLIVYGHALGRCAALQYGKVLAINPKKHRRWDGNEWHDEDTPHFTVQGVDTHWSGKVKLLRKGTLQFGDRILIVNRDQVPVSILGLLDSVQVRP